MRSPILRSAVVLAVLTWSATAIAADPPSPAFDDRRATTHHELTLDGRAQGYTATAEFLPLRSPGKDEAEARIFTVSYTLDGADPAKRPVMFLFNGGPGASSAYLHLGAAGPRAIRFAPDGGLPPPPTRLEDNPDTWLTAADLVFIDPVGTGFSRLTKEDDKVQQRLLSVEGDVAAMAETIRFWLTRNTRWGSPKFLGGESYGGYRVAALTRHLIDREGIALNGAVMVSPVIDFGTIRDSDSGILAAALRLPSMAAAAVATGKVPGNLIHVTEDAERYALGDYIAGLAGLDLERLEASRPLFDKVAALTGLPEPLVERQRGRIGAGFFAREILRDRGQVVSLYDGAHAAFDPDPGSPRVRQDPILEASKPTFTTAYMDYVKGELKSPVDDDFRLLSNAVNERWEWQRGEMPNAANDLQTALALAPDLRVTIVHGRTDLVTPYLGSVWIVRNLEQPADRRDRVNVDVFDGGHMLYFRRDGRAALAGAVRDLVAKATAPR